MSIDKEDVEYLFDLAEMLLKVPATYGFDQRASDTLYRVAAHLKQADRTTNPDVAPGEGTLPQNAAGALVKFSGRLLDGDRLQKDARQAEELPFAERLSYFLDLRGLHTYAETLKKEVSKVHEEWKTRVIPKMFEDANASTHTIKGVARITVSQKTYASITNQADGYEWLRKNELGGLIQETVNASSLSAAAKELMGKGMELPEEYFKVTIMPSVSVTAVKN